MCYERSAASLRVLYMFRCRPECTLSMCTASDLIRSATRRDIFGNELIVSAVIPAAVHAPRENVCERNTFNSADIFRGR